MIATRANNNVALAINAPPSRRGSPHAEVNPATGWLHLCNGLDPMRDGGMVPSILGMTEALSRLKGEVTIVTPTQSRLDQTHLANGLTLKAPETAREAAVASAEIAHMQGLWRAPTRRGARA